VEDGSHVGAFAIVGDFGFGKTTWLIEARQRTGDGNTAFLAITERATTQNEVLTFLASVSVPPQRRARVPKHFPHGCAGERSDWLSWMTCTCGF
jgi:hypothetical protein